MFLIHLISCLLLRFVLTERNFLDFRLWNQTEEERIDDKNHIQFCVFRLKFKLIILFTKLILQNFNMFCVLFFISAMFLLSYLRLSQILFCTIIISHQPTICSSHSKVPWPKHAKLGSERVYWYMYVVVLCAGLRLKCAQKGKRSSTARGHNPTLNQLLNKHVDENHFVFSY